MSDLHHSLAWEADDIGGVNVETHEANLQETLERLLPEGGVLLDVGAHVGLWTVRLAPRASRVIAVEPNVVASRVLTRNIALNHFRHVEVVELAAWDSNTRLRLVDPHRVADDTGWMRTLPVDNGCLGDVPARRLDEVLVFGRLDLVKVDVEGAELHALRGMSGILDRFSPTLFIERHDMWGYYHISELCELLTGLGYDCVEAPRFNQSEYLICTKP